MNRHGLRVCATALCALAASTAAPAAALILNEYNCVRKTKYLRGANYADDTREDAYFATIAGLPDGRIEGNGGNWIELVVVQDHLDVRGWKLKWAETGAHQTNRTDIWFGDANIEQGILTFSSTAPIWSDLRSGTIITVGEQESIDVDTDLDDEGNRNFTDELDRMDVDLTIDLSTDVSCDPLAGDWWIHVSSRHEQDEYTRTGGTHHRLIRTETNVAADGPGDFAIGEEDWQLTIEGAAEGVVFGPIGEDVYTWGGGGINDKEIGKLEADPSAGVTVRDFHDGSSSTFGRENIFDGGTERQDFGALRAWVPEPTTLLLLAAAMPLALKPRRARR